MTQNTYAHHPAMTLHEAAMLKAEEKCHPIKDGIFECKVNRTYASPEPSLPAAHPRRGAPVARRAPCSYLTCMIHKKGVERAE